MEEKLFLDEPTTKFGNYSLHLHPCSFLWSILCSLTMMFIFCRCCSFILPDWGFGVVPSQIFDHEMKCFDPIHLNSLNLFTPSPYHFSSTDTHLGLLDDIWPDETPLIYTVIYNECSEHATMTQPTIRLYKTSQWWLTDLLEAVQHSKQLFLRHLLPGEKPSEVILVSFTHSCHTIWLSMGITVHRLSVQITVSSDFIWLYDPNHSSPSRCWITLGFSCRQRLSNWHDWLISS